MSSYQDVYSNQASLNEENEYMYYSQTTTNQVESYKVKKRNRSTPQDSEKRKNFLERNRLAALKCRQRKKQWLSNLQARVEFLTNDNDQLQLQTDILRKEILELKTLLLAHKDCPHYIKSNQFVTQPVLYHHSMHLKSL